MAAPAACRNGCAAARWQRYPAACPRHPKELVFPVIPAKPAALFLYMYIARLGFLDGMAGLRFCFYHAWFEMSVASLRAEARDSGEGKSHE